jgi:Cof subfamily protein (haloacid dehalogenase superfamily)
MIKIAAVCADIDGTLLDSRRELSDRTIQAVKRVNNAGIPLILASSRMPGAMRHLQQQLGILKQPIISFNGGYVILDEGDSSSTVILNSVTIPLSICSTIGELAAGTSVHISLYREDQWFAPMVDQWTHREQTITKVNATILPFDSVMSQWKTAALGAHKVMCMGDEGQIGEFYSELVNMFFNDLHIYRSRPTYLEIAPKTVSKATALELLMKKRFNMDLSNVMAFGDNYNDVDMIRTTGYGIAVGNAIQEVKDVAKEITLNSKDDGVAIAIEKYFP